LYPHAHVVAFHYRGYAPSSGRPGAEALLGDALLVHDELTARLKPERVVAAGFSIGTGPAARLASRRPLHGLILVTPFDSLAKVAGGHYRWVPVALLFRHRLEPARDLTGSRTPVAILAGTRDTLIVPERTLALRRAVPNLVFERSFPAGHNDIYDHPGFRTAMREALQQVTAVAASSS
ncbi:MAG: alpha/beta hydrolase, partial [Pseudomonadota bacterium]|nr:alpha/beta hydrolase [Pseudomonadota bacterium]